MGILLIDDSGHEWIQKAIKETIGLASTVQISHGSGISMYQKKA